MKLIRTNKESSGIGLPVPGLPQINSDTIPCPVFATAPPLFCYINVTVPMSILFELHSLALSNGRLASVTFLQKVGLN